MNRCTIRGSARVEGVGLFGGRPGAVTLERTSGGGIVFVIGGVEVAAAAGNVVKATGGVARNTSLAGCATIEHVMSALIGLGVTEARVVVEGPEVPIGDGSAEMFVDAIARAGGLHQLPEPFEPIRLKVPVEVRGAGGEFIRATPRARAGCSFEYTLDYAGRPGPAVGVPRQTARWDGRAATYQVDVAPARTFCLASEAKAMRDRGLFAHVTPREMLVLDDLAGEPIDNTLRFENEPARHKLLDLIGDVGLLGRPLQADVVAERSGHALTHEFCRAVLGG
ncbi:MAG: UDP-3-O-acyl-N-acetylglucosamine deacetylase [Planctomycetota bacterium]